MNKDSREILFNKVSRILDPPMLVLALAMIPLMIIDFSPSQTFLSQQFITTSYLLIWAAFAVEYILKLYLSPERWIWAKKNWHDFLIVVLPFLRPLRALRLFRLLRLVRLGALMRKVSVLASDIFGRHGFIWVCVVLLVIAGVCAGLIIVIEPTNPTIESYPDALWWALTTISTVGYGDIYPISDMGRIVSTVLIIAGIAFFGIVTAQIASWFVKLEIEDETDPIGQDIAEIKERLERIETMLRE